MAVKIVIISHTLDLDNNLSRLGDGVNGWTTDDTTSNWELGAGAAEESVDLTSALASFIDTPAIKLVYYVFRMNKNRRKLTKQSKTVHGDSHLRHKRQEYWSSSGPAES